MVADVFHFYADAVEKHFGEMIPVAGGGDMTFREPLGVVGLMRPWNFPMNITGFGRELGVHALEGYSEVENVYFATEP